MNEQLLFEQMLDLYATQREADQQQRMRCQRGEHDMLATASPGVVVCRLCRTLGVCLWCGMTLPQGACIVVCARHVGAVQWQARHQRTVEARPPLRKGDPRCLTIIVPAPAPTTQVRPRWSTTTSGRPACHQAATAIHSRLSSRATPVS